MTTQLLCFSETHISFLLTASLKHCFRMSLIDKSIYICTHEHLLVGTCQTILPKFYIQLQLRIKGQEKTLTCGNRWSSASPLIVPTARATKKVRRNLKHHWLMMGIKITPSKESRLMTVIEMIPQNQAVGRNEYRKVVRTILVKFFKTD